MLSYRGADFAQAALAVGADDKRIIFTHMIPNGASHIIVTTAAVVFSVWLFSIIGGGLRDAIDPYAI